MNRRNFVKNSLSLLGMYALAQVPFSSRAFASVQKNKSQFLITLRVPGGIDTLLSSDPLIANKVLTRNYLPLASNDWWQLYKDESLISSKNQIYGPAMNVIQEFLPDLSVVNGVVMLPKDVSHENNLKHFDNSEITHPDHITFELAKYLKPSPISVVTNSNLPGMTLLNNLGSQLFANNSKYNSFFETASEIDEEDSLTATRKSLNQARKAVIASQSRVGNTPSNKGKQVNTSNQAELINQVFSSFMSGISQVAVLNYEPKLKLDTHIDHHLYHQKGLTEVFGFLSDLIHALKNTLLHQDSSETLFDVTTVVMYTEFARSAYREKVSGTAHNPLNNSVWLAGGAIKGGLKIGASDILPAQFTVDKKYSSLRAMPFQFDKQEAISLKEIYDNNGVVQFANSSTDVGVYDYIKPCHVWATVAESLGIKNSSLSQNRILSKLLK